MKNSSPTSPSKDSSPAAKLKSSLNSLMGISSEYLLAGQVKSFEDGNGAECVPDLSCATISKMTNRWRTKSEERNSVSGSTEPQCLPCEEVGRFVYTGRSFTKTHCSLDFISR